MQSQREESLRTRTDVIHSLRKRLEELNAAEEEMVNSCRLDMLLFYVSCTLFHNNQIYRTSCLVLFFFPATVLVINKGRAKYCWQSKYYVNLFVSLFICYYVPTCMGICLHVNSFSLFGGTFILYFTIRTALREEYDEVRESSKISLDNLKTDLEKNISAMVSHGARHEELELQLRKKR